VHRLDQLSSFIPANLFESKSLTLKAAGRHRLTGIKVHIRRRNTIRRMVPPELLPSCSYGFTLRAPPFSSEVRQIPRSKMPPSSTVTRMEAAPVTAVNGGSRRSRLDRPLKAR